MTALNAAAVTGAATRLAGDAERGDRLPPLRDDLKLLPGPSFQGAPTWTLHDPVRGRYFRIDRQAFELLARWPLGDAATVRRVMAEETPFAPAAADVDDFGKFLLANNLVRCEGRDGIDRLLRQARAARPPWGRWLLQNYLFLRVPLVRPDRALDALAPLTAPLFTAAALWLLLLAGGLGVFLAVRQWDSFVHTFFHFFSWDGLAWFAVAMVGVKIVHELGHALTAKRFGCRVPTMGVALLVLFPVLYTDTSEAWRLTSRRQRLAIGAAGVVAEIAVAALATLAWSFLPDGPARSAAFFLATTSWTLSLLINVNPFMRFDGYYLLSDWLGVENLQARSFALGRWRLRRSLLGIDEPPPERFPPRLAVGLTIYAYATWMYRLVLLIAIAVLVYYFFFKALGVLLFVVEILWFIVLPVWRELGEWWRRRHLLRLTPNLVLTLIVLGGLVWLAVVPWSGRVALPAVLRDDRHAAIHPPFPARIAALHATRGATVAEGDVLFVLELPELAHEIVRERRRLATTRVILQRRAAQRHAARDVGVLEEELAAALSALTGLAERQAALTVTAPVGGLVVDLSEGLRVGRWVGLDDRLATILDPDAAVLRAYVGGAELAQIEVGASARFYPEDPLAPPIDARVADVETVNVATLDTPYLASLHGGDIAVLPAADNRLVPVPSVYRVVLEPSAPITVPPQVQRGTVHVEGEARSLADRAWRMIAAVLIRESGF